MTTTTAGRTVDAGTKQALKTSYKSLVKAGNDSVRAAWRFGQCIDSFTDHYRMDQLAGAMGLSVSTLSRYRRLYGAFQRPELAVEASEQLETYNIDTICDLQNQLGPAPHGRPLAGRRWTLTCRSCGGHEVGRDEIDPQTGELLAADGEASETGEDGETSGKVIQFSSAG